MNSRMGVTFQPGGVNIYEDRAMNKFRATF